MTKRGKNQKSGKVITLASANPWPHEKRVATILAKVGYIIEFIPEASIKTPDIYLGRTEYEIKSPTSDKIDAVERNLTRALEKCPNIVFDSSRMRVRDNKILNELVKCLRNGKGLKKIIFINKRGEIIDINKFI